MNGLCGRQRRGELLQMFRGEELGADGVAGRWHHSLLNTGKKSAWTASREAGTPTVPSQRLGILVARQGLAAGDGAALGRIAAAASPVLRTFRPPADAAAAAPSLSRAREREERKTPGDLSRRPRVLVAGEGFTAGENAGVRPGCRGFCRGPGLRTFRPLRGPFKSFPITVKKNETPESEPSTFGS
jgi:hypothetical protein